jgi:hypothetical protein
MTASSLPVPVLSNSRCFIIVGSSDVANNRYRTEVLVHCLQMIMLMNIIIQYSVYGQASTHHGGFK